MILTASLLVFSACNSEKKEDKDKMTTNSGESQEEKNKATALASVNALIAGDVDGVLKDVAATGTIVDYGDGSMPPVTNLDTLRAGMKAWRGVMSEFKADNLLAVADGDYVIVYGEWSVTYKEDFMGMKTAGKSYKVNDVDIFKFNSEGKMIEHRSIYPFSAVMAQMGVTAPK